MTNPQTTARRRHNYASIIFGLLAGFALMASLYLAMGVGQVVTYYRAYECGFVCGLLGFMLLGTGAMAVIAVPLLVAFVMVCVPYEDDVPIDLECQKVAYRSDATTSNQADGQSVSSSSNSESGSWPINDSFINRNGL